MIRAAHISLLAALLTPLLTTACATTAPVGVRRGFEATRVAVVTVAPVYATSHFGLTDDEWRRLEQIAVDEMANALVGLGFRVVTPEKFRDQLERQDTWHRFVRLVEFRDGLDNRFEPSLYAAPSAEIAELQQLVADEVIGDEPILFVEIVYQSSGHCSADAREFNRFATIVSTDGKPLDELTPSPCIVTHMQAKLVSPTTSTTMWHNRVLREMRGRTITVTDGRNNVRIAARQLVRGPHGLVPFAPPPKSATALR